jgi:hypothetical protein
MAVTEEDIAKVLNLVPTCSNADTVECLMEKDELQHLSKAIYEALHILEELRKLRGEELLGRN